MLDFNDIIHESNQRPTFSAGIEIGDTEGAYAAQMSADYGHEAYPWQELALNIIFADDIYMIGLACPRQNGKNGVIEMVELYAAAVLGCRILHTAHRGITAVEGYTRVRTRWFENPKYKELCEICSVSHAKGQEQIVFDNGGRIEFTTRSAVGGRGLSLDWLILDEAQEMDDDSWSSLSPTLTASPNARIILTGTPPLSSRDGAGVIFQRFRKKALSGELSPKQAYLEWGIPDMEKVDVSDEDVWRRVNPSWDYRINKDVLRGDFDMMSREGFAREHLGYWYKTSFNTIFSTELWNAGQIKKTPESAMIEKFAIGVVFSQDGESWCYSIGMVLNDGSYYTELMDCASTKKGTAELMGVVDHLRGKRGFVGVITHGKAGSLNLLGDCDARGIPNRIVELCRQYDKIAANSLFEQLINTKQIKHSGQKRLTESVLSLDKYLINAQGGGFQFISRSNNLIASEASALALYWAKNRKAKNTGKKQTIW